jgi:hypothetical protein
MKDVIDDMEPTQRTEPEYQKLPVVATPATLLQMAVEQNADIDKLEKLMELQTKWEEREAQRAYVAAMSGFRAECPTIVKTREGHNSKYAGLAETIDKIKPLLANNGLSHTWKTNQDNGIISVTCCVTHVQGHSECTTLEAGADTSGSKNNIQAMGSTISYLERYTLYAILGLASGDDDGQAPEPIEKITDEQALELEAMITDNDIDTKRVKAWMAQTLKVNSFTDINVNAYKTVLNKINATIKAQK